MDIDWTERLNKSLHALDLGCGRVEILYWHRQAHLPDNQPHTHTFFEVCQVGRWGSGLFRAQGQEVDIAPGDVFVARPGKLHQIVNRGDGPLMELRWVCFQWIPSQNAGGDSKAGAGDDIDRLMRDFTSATIVATPDSDNRVGALWDALQTLAQSRPRAGYEVQARALLQALILAIAQCATPPDVSDPHEDIRADAGDLTARIAIRYIHDNMNRPLSLPEIAAHVAVSPRHLARVFRKYVGSSPATYVLRSRLDRAAGMLTRSPEPIKEVAVRVGLGDVHHFTRVFSRHYGCPPGEYRRIGRGAYVPNRQNEGALI